MIPQRNLSLLANRLFKEHEERRIPEAVLERDYCLAWFLIGLSQSHLKDILVFKGGTALKRCHFGDYRFSEDLDFTLARPAEFAAIREGLEEIYQYVAQASGIRFAFDREDRQNHVNSYTFYLSYQGPLPTPNSVKVDITISEVLCPDRTTPSPTGIPGIQRPSRRPPGLGLQPERNRRRKSGRTPGQGEKRTPGSLRPLGS